jgi:hypothetical protein
MKGIINFLRECPGAYVYSIALGFSIYNNDKLCIGVFGTSFLYNLLMYGRDKINKEYTDWLEKDREYWHTKFLEEKIKLPSKQVESIITKN